MIILKEFIEQLLEQELQSNQRPKFSFDELETLTNYKDKEKYLFSTLKRIGEGLSRLVFLLPDGDHVLKLQKKQYNQNLFEYEASKCIDSEYIAKVVKISPTLDWIVMEKAELFDSIFQIEAELFDRIPGLDRAMKSYNLEIDNVLYDAIEAENSAYKKTIDNLVENSPWLKGFVDNMKKCKVAAHDFHRGNWGMTADGRLVLIDYGFEMK